MTAVGDDLEVLIGDAVDGKAEAIEGVLRRIRPLVVRYCRSRVGSQERSFASADDVAQEVCLAVLTALPSYGPEAQLMQAEFADKMTHLLDMLPEKQREILRLRIVVGLSAEETAEAVGSTPGAVRVAQHRALGRLRGVLAAEGVV
ncbi:MAG: sigma-70 family RNA polymerase sigma factor [Actinomycetota bacterium]|nr:sigma-70 family RNA polymerase sigma factor [Actinomycetota bacterium]